MIDGSSGGNITAQLSTRVSRFGDLVAVPLEPDIVVYSDRADDGRVWESFALTGGSGDTDVDVTIFGTEDP